MLDNKKRAIVSIIIYLLIMIIGVSINNNFFSSMENNSGELVSRSIIQLVSSAYIFYIIKKDKHLAILIRCLSFIIYR